MGFVQELNKSQSLCEGFTCLLFPSWLLPPDNALSRVKWEQIACAPLTPCRAVCSNLPHFLNGFKAICGELNNSYKRMCLSFPEPMELVTVILFRKIIPGDMTKLKSCVKLSQTFVLGFLLLLRDTMTRATLIKENI